MEMEIDLDPMSRQEIYDYIKLPEALRQFV